MEKKSKYFAHGYFSVEVNGVLYSNPFTNVRRIMEVISKIRGAAKQNAEIDRFLSERAEWELLHSEKTKKNLIQKEEKNERINFNV